MTSLLLLLLLSPVSAKLDSAVIISEKEICKGVIEVQFIINNAYHETYYDYDNERDPIKCFIKHYGIEGHTDRYGL